MSNDYSVKKGDTLWGIANHHGLSVKQLADWNNLQSSQIHSLKIGQLIHLKPVNQNNDVELELTIKLLDLAFEPIKKATLRLEYDGKSRTENLTNGEISNLLIEDHSKGLKVYFKNISGTFDLIADHKRLPVGRKTLTLTSRSVKVKGAYAAKEGVAQRTTNNIQRELKEHHNAILNPPQSPPPSRNADSGTKPEQSSNINTPAVSNIPQEKVSTTGQTPQSQSKPAVLLPPKVPTAEIQPINQTMRTDEGNHTHVVAVQFTEDNLFLSKGNSIYRKYIVDAAKRNGFSPQGLAALINAEAAKTGKGNDQHWNPDSKNDKTSAGGLSQFLDGAWLDMCTNNKSLVCQYVNKHSKLNERAKLKLKFNPEFAIDAAAVYAADNIAQLGKKPYNLPVDKITDPSARAKLAYLTHHEGVKGAYRLIMDLDDNNAATKRLHTQIPKQADQYIARFNDEGKNASKTAYAVWFRDYVDQQISLQAFTIKPYKDGITTFPSEATLDSVIVALGGKSYCLKQPKPKVTAKEKSIDQSKQPKNQANAQTTPQTNSSTTNNLPTNISTISPSTSSAQATGVGGANAWHDPLAHCMLRTAGLADVKSATFGMVRNGGTRAHQGVDLAAEPGTPIYAVASGTVAAINKDDSGDYGKYIVIQVNADDLPNKQKNYALDSTDKDGNRIDSTTHQIYFFYAHLSEINVDVNIPHIDVGQELGKTGHTGNAKSMTTISKGAHLHFEARLIPKTRKGLEERIDPIPFFNTHFSY